ncbi:zinc finger protein 80-like [Mercenaria mercenaria]|uniref:zinc finger protein 80-like n=1 Tax=Mercenaria mercenaria TaxID=6596 RepID=UPI00234F3DF9|nr:zinc finger protein 80-like [Mercenaria mercenaria]
MLNVTSNIGCVDDISSPLNMGDTDDGDGDLESQLESAEEEEVNKVTTYMCEICNRVFNQQSLFNRHKTIHETPKYTCQICNKTFAIQYRLTRHLETHSSANKCMCSFCGKEYSREV